VDIVTQVKPEKLAAALKTVAKIAPFTGYEHDAERDRDLPTKKHFRVFYPQPSNPRPTTFSSMSCSSAKRRPIATQC
jgi:hypothetical protein